MGLAAVGAAGALAMGGATAIGATVTAIGAGTLGALSVGTIFSAVGAVGAVLGAVGAAAGISELKTAGMVIGGIGGIGALANSVGVFGEAASINSIFGGGEAAATAAGTGGAAGASGAAGFFDAEAGVWTDAATGGLINGGAGANSLDIVAAANDTMYRSVGEMEGLAGGGPGIADTAKAGSSGVLKTAGAVSDVSKLAQQAKPNETAAPTTDNLSSVTKGAPSNPVIGDDFKNPTTGAAYKWDGRNWVESKGFWGSNNAALLGMGALQAGGSFLEGAFDEVKPAQAAAYSAQAEANNAQAALDKKQLSNMNEGIPVARRLDVTGRIGRSLINGGALA